jgi:hypothetical protein
VVVIRSKVNGPVFGLSPPSATTAAAFHVDCGPDVSRMYSSVVPSDVCRSRRFAMSSGKSGFCGMIPGCRLFCGSIVPVVTVPDGAARCSTAELAALAVGAEGLQGLGADERLGDGERVLDAAVVGLHARDVAALAGGRLRVAGGRAPWSARSREARCSARSIFPLISSARWMSSSMSPS